MSISWIVRSLSLTGSLFVSRLAAASAERKRTTTNESALNDFAAILLPPDAAGLAGVFQLRRVAAVVMRIA